MICVQRMRIPSRDMERRGNGGWAQGKTCDTMEGVVEYLSTWPPPESSINNKGALCSAELSSLSANICLESPPPKRLRYELEHEADGRVESLNFSEDDSYVEELQHQLSLEELHTVHCHYSVSADALLARWWKVTSKLEHTSASHDERVVSLNIKSNVGPQTQLYHISRYQLIPVMDPRGGGGGGGVF